MATWFTPSSSMSLLSSEERAADLVGEPAPRAGRSSLRAEVQSGAGGVEGGTGQLRPGLARQLEERPHLPVRPHDDQLQVAPVLADEEVAVARRDDVVDARQ